MTVQSIWLVIAVPLLGALLNGVLGRRLGRDCVSAVGSGVVGVAFVIGLLVMVRLLASPPEGRAVSVTLWDWITIGSLQVSVVLLADPLSLLMVLVVTGVGFLIHLYSIGYLHGAHEDERLHARFFAYLNLFIASMLLLVLADNYLVMYVGWELVGACSYLLIGFWFHRRDEAQAPIALSNGDQVVVPAHLNSADSGKKAFIVNRVGDFAFALGLFLMWTTFGTLNFAGVFDAAAQAPAATITAITLLLFVGAIGKSAQLPLHVWLPDAMAGPTPVSALIHAATMVTAGVYLVARSHVLYTLAPTSSLIVAIVGVVTALYASTIALVQVDLKRVLAYSTISQLGTMFTAMGVGAYAAGMFHLATHAFFKALLFLAAGSIMHALHEVTDVRRMGGLRRKMPLTYLAFLMGALALAGFPLTAGFFSKDEILVKAFEFSPVLWAVGLLTALLTAFYTFRALFLVFWGQPRDWELFEHAHESPRVMTGPLAVLAALALAGGLLGLPAAFGAENVLGTLLAPAFPRAAAEVASAQGVASGLEWVLLGISGVVALLGMGVAYWLVVVRTDIPQRLAVAMRPAFTLLVNEYYVDDAYDWLFVRGGKRLAALLAHGFDPMVDGLIDGGARLLLRSGGWLERFEDGHIPRYALGMFIGAMVLVAYLILH